MSLLRAACGMCVWPRERIIGRWEREDEDHHSVSGSYNDNINKGEYMRASLTHALYRHSVCYC